MQSNQTYQESEIIQQKFKVPSLTALILIDLVIINCQLGILLKKYNSYYRIRMVNIREGSSNLTDYVSNAKRGTKLSQKEEELFIGTAESEHIEMYLKAIWYLHEKGQDAKVSSIAKLLNVTQPSVVQMLRKLHDSNLVKYSPTHVTLTEVGRKTGMQMIRNTRLLEVMMKDALKIEIDEEMACGIEHHMKTIFTDALCSLLRHPRKCPHGHDIPKGKCCTTQAH